MSDPFRVAVLADIHGNRDALDVVLADVHHQSPHHIICAGDLVMNGPHPLDALTRIANLNIPGVLGNTDDEVIKGDDSVATWTQHAIGRDGVAYLQTLLPSYRLTPPQATSPQHDLLIVHSTPRSCYDLLILEPHPLGTNFTEPTPYADAVEMLAGTRAGLIVYGHIHYVSDGVIDGQRIMSIGSVGFPFDGDQCAAYAIAHWDGINWQIEHRRIAYNYEHVAANIEHSTIPFAPRYARMIREANWFARPA